MDISDFDKMFVTKAEWKILKSLQKKPGQKIESQIAHSPNLIQLVSCHTIGQGINKMFDGTYSLNRDGRNFISYLEAKNREKFFSQSEGMDHHHNCNCRLVKIVLARYFTADLLVSNKVTASSTNLQNPARFLPTHG